MNDERSIGPFQVLEVSQKGGTFYTCSLPAKTLIDIAYSDVRHLAKEERDIERYLGIQRPIDPKRVNEIRDYIDSPDPYFPTGIILAIDERCVDFDEDKSMMTLHAYEAEQEFSDDVSIPKGKIAKILDGQHRLAGFLDKDGEYRHEVDTFGDFQMNVSLFVGADISVQAQIFAKVNLAQTKVNRSLVYDLESLAKTRSPFKTCHNVAVALDEIADSPFYRRVKRLGVVTEGRSQETITQAAFVESLVRLISKRPFEDRNRMLDGRTLPRPTSDELITNPFRGLFIDEADFDIAENVMNYFLAIKQRWPEAWADTSRQSGFLPKTNAFKAFMRYLKDSFPALQENAGKKVVPVEHFATLFYHLDGLRDRELSTKVFVPGGSGEAMFYRVLNGTLSPDALFEKT